MKSLESLNPKFVSMIRQASASDNGISTSLLDLSEWPGIHFILTGSNGKPVGSPARHLPIGRPTTPPPARPSSRSPRAPRPTRPINPFSGLPLFNNYYTVFDRSQGKGNGVISFAPIKRS
jgi:hypothetical protein